MKTNSTPMCAKCNRSLIKKHAGLKFNNPIIGKFTIQNVEYYLCEKCNNILIVPEESNRVELEEIKLCIKHILKTSGPQPLISLKNYLIKITNCKLDNIIIVVSKLENEKEILITKTGRIKVLTLIKKKEKQSNIKKLMCKLFRRK